MLKRDRKVKRSSELVVLNILSVSRWKVQALRGLGMVSVGALAVFGIVAINPVVEKAEATNGYEQDLLNYEMAPAAVTLTMDSGTNGVIRAGDTDASVGVVKRTAGLSVGTTNGYMVYLRANSTDLTGKDVANNIPSVTSNSTLAQMLDKWGWYGVLGDTVADCDPSGTFKQVPTTDTTLGTGGATKETVNKKITMCFGTRVSGAKAADTYSNTVTVSVVAEPGQSSTRTFSGITTMQEMTPAICSKAAINDTSYLRDTRDNKSYWVTKLMDGNCWMSQNLDFDISTNNVTTSTSDVTSNWTSSSTYPPQVTTGLKSSSSGLTGTESRDLGMYVSTKPMAVAPCSAAANPSSCTEQLANVGGWMASSDPNFYRNNSNSIIQSSTKTYDTHYLVGNYYQWNAATAGTGGAISATSATGSICPKGWRLPNGNQTSGGYDYLLKMYGLQTKANIAAGATSSPINGSDYDIALSPLFFVRGGSAGAELNGVGQGGYYWSLRAGYGNQLAYMLQIEGDSINAMSYTMGYRSLFFTVRCLVQGA